MVPLRMSTTSWPFGVSRPLPGHKSKIFAVFVLQDQKITLDPKLMAKAAQGRRQENGYAG